MADDLQSSSKTNKAIRPAKNKTATPQARSTKSKAGISDNGLNLSGDEFNFGVDENRNALIFYTTGEQFLKIYNLLQRPDVQPLQVLLEVTLADVTLEDDLAYGLNGIYETRCMAVRGLVKR